MTDLVTRLRARMTATQWKRGLDLDYATAWEPDSVCNEAADEIESLRELLRICRAERDELAAGHYENERLRAALRDLLDDTQHAEHRCEDADCPVSAARAALRD